MNDRRSRVPGLVVACALAAAAPMAAQRKEPVKKEAASAATQTQSSPPRIRVAVDSLFDRRTTSDFPRPELSIAFRLEGEDAGSVQSARARITRAVDDTGKDLAQTDASSGSERWQPASENGPPRPRIELASPSRKAKKIASMEGIVETYLPSRDPAATVTIERVLTKKDKPLVVPALASQHVQVQILSKAGLEDEKKQAEAKKKAEAAKKKEAEKKTDGLDEMAQAMADTLVATLERLFMTAGDNDLILKVDDPEKKIFSFDLAAPNGTAIRSYGTTDLEGYRIVRMFEPIPEAASLQVRLKTARSFGSVAFAFSDVKLP